MRAGRRLFATSVAALALTARVAAAEEPAGVAAVASAPPIAPPVSAPPPRPEGAAVVAPGPNEPLAGLAGERAFLRSPGNEIVLYPGLLVQVGGEFFPPRDNLPSGFSLRRARLELSGWMGSMFYFDVAGDFVPVTVPVASAGRPPTDAYVAFAPMGDLFILQAGQFDVPFSLENRTLDPYIPFVDRSLVVRTLAAPYNKDLGLMAHGTDDARMFYYSGGLFNGEGPGLHNGDNRVDVIGRVSVSPFARTSLESLHEASIGASAWYGQHVAGRAFPTQTTPGGFVFFNPEWNQTSSMKLDLLESGPTLTLGGEINLPIGHQFGVRGEGIVKQQDLAEAVVPADGSMPTTVGRAHMFAFGGYGEVWAWLLGDDRQLPRPGFELPVHLGRVAEPSPRHGVMVTARGEVLQEDLTSAQTANADPNLATTRVATATLGVNYWYGRRVRATANYLFTYLSGSTENIKDITVVGQTEHEFLFLVAMGL
jgi:hypothetical protein